MRHTIEPFSNDCPLWGRDRWVRLRQARKKIGRRSEEVIPAAMESRLLSVMNGLVVLTVAMVTHVSFYPRNRAPEPRNWKGWCWLQRHAIGARCVPTASKSE